MDGLAGFHPAIRTWFERRFPEGPTDPQALGWPAIAAGRDTLIAAPTGSGKTLAAFLVCIDRLFRTAARRARAATTGPRSSTSRRSRRSRPTSSRTSSARSRRSREVARELGLVVAGSARGRAHRRHAAPARAPRCSSQPPHILITTPESLYLLLTAERSRGMLRGVRTVIVDEIHAVARDKRGSHLALTLERLERAARSAGRSASASRPRSGRSRRSPACWSARRGAQRARRRARVRDRRPRPPPRSSTWPSSCPTSELAAVASHEQWARDPATGSPAHVRAHRTTLVFVNTRRLAERVAHLLAERLGEGQVAAHHGSLSKERRLARRGAAQRGRPGGAGGDGLARARHRHRAGRAGLPDRLAAQHRDACCSASAARATPGAPSPRGGVYPTTRDELVESDGAAPRPCGAGSWIACSRRGRRSTSSRSRSWPRAPPRRGRRTSSSTWSGAPRPTRDLDRADFDAVVDHAVGWHPDRARPPGGLPSPRPRPRRAPRPAERPPRRADVGRRHPRDRGLSRRRGSGRHRGRHRQRGLGDREHGGGRLPARQHLVADPPRRGRRRARGRRPGRAAHGAVLARRGAGADGRGCRRPCRRFARRSTSWLATGGRRVGRGVARRRVPASTSGSPRQSCGTSRPRRVALGVLPTQRRVVFERFFDEAGGMQLVVHAPFGGRINRALGLALRQALLPSASTSSCRPRPATTPSCSRSGRSTASRSRTCRSS